MPPLLEGLAGFASPQIAGALLLGTLAGLAAGLTPGVSGRAGLLLVTPVAIGFGPAAGAVFLVAFHSVVHTSGSVPAILVGAPTSAAEAATVIDGYALTRRGQGARAIGATLSASAAGGVIGALCLFLLIPVAGAVIGRIGTPEIAALSVLGLLSIAALSGGRMAGGLMTAALGVAIAATGLDPFSGAPRFTFGLLELWDGVSPAALITGLFVVPELAARERAGETNSGRAGWGEVLAGCAETARHGWLVLRASLIGVLAGLAPGLGASVAVWLAYGHARQSHPSATPYGEGALAGVIAPEAANNSKEGGALAPTLFLGVPSSSGMGILLAAFAALGIEVGPRMLSADPGFAYRMGWTNILSNLIALPLCLVLAPAMARVSAIRRDQVAPVALAAALTATVLTGGGAVTLAQVALFSALGLLLKAGGFPRAPLLLGFVLGPALESAVVRAGMIHGWSALLRPGVILIGGAALALAAAASMRRRTAPAAQKDESPLVPRALAILVSALLMAAAALAALPLPPTASVSPVVAAAAALGAAGLEAARLWRRRRTPAGERETYDALMLGLFAATLALAVPLGVPMAGGAFVFGVLFARDRSAPLRAGVVALVLAGLTLLAVQAVR